MHRGRPQGLLHTAVLKGVAVVIVVSCVVVAVEVLGRVVVAAVDVVARVVDDGHMSGPHDAHPQLSVVNVDLHARAEGWLVGVEEGKERWEGKERQGQERTSSRARGSGTVTRSTSGCTRGSWWRECTCPLR